MASNIDVAVPPFGNATTAGVRANFLAAKQEIEVLQTARAIRVQRLAGAIEDFQQCQVSNVQQVVAFNSVTFNHGGIFNFDAANNEVEFLEAGYYSALVNFQVVRKVTGGGCDFSIHAELKPPGGAFTDFEGSSRVITIHSSEALSKDWRAYTVMTRIPVAGYRVRWLQLATDASKQVGIVSYPAVGDLPSAAGIVFSLWKVGEEL